MGTASLPPESYRIDGKGWCFITGAYHDKTPVGLRIENAVRDRHSFRIAAKIVVVDLVGLLFPGDAIIFEISDHLFLFSVHAHYCHLLRGELLSLVVDVLKLPIADAPRRRVLVARFQRLLVDAQGEPHVVQQASHGVGADVDSQFPELSGNVAGRLACPLQTVHGIAGLVMLEQFGNMVDHVGRFFSVDRRPAPFFRTLCCWTCRVKSS